MAFNDDEMPPSSNTGSTRGLVTITPAKFFKEDASLTADTVTAEVEINATSSTAVREGLDLVAVLDMSGAKDGEKMKSMKKAMVFVIMKLTAVDRLSIVSFSDGATRLSPLRSMTPAAQNNLISLVNGLLTGGGTNIEAGLETALAVIADRVHTKARTASIFLMSDRHQTAGDARQVDPGQVPIYTFGFGKGTDHQLMSDIAMSSPGGTFSSVPDGSMVSLPFSQLLGGLVTVVAQDVELTVTPRTEEGDVDTVAVAPSAGYTLDTDADTGVVTVKLGTLFAGERRRVVVTLALKDVSGATSEEYEALLAEVQHSFTAQGKQRDLQRPQGIQITRTPPATSQAMGDGQLVNSLRAELEQLTTLMNTQELYGAQAGGGPIALATETCHGRRRYAARGDDGDGDGDVRLFATPRMNTYLEQARNFDNDPIVAPPVPSAGDEDDDAKQEMMIPNPLSAISPEFTYYLRNAIVSLQAIENLDKVPSHGDVSASSKGKKARQVQAEIARQHHAETIRQARLLADDGRLDEARCKLLEAEEELDDGKKLVNSLHAELEQLVKLMETKDLYEAQGRPYALASETCHGRRRRYAAVAAHDDVRLFATPRMETYWERQAKNFEKDPAADEDDVKKEVIAANPLAAVSTELAFYLGNAIQALQAVDKIVAQAPSSVHS